MQRVCSWTVQNEMRGVMGQVSASAARRIFDSANPRDRSLTEHCVHCSKNERKQRARQSSTSSLAEIEETCVP